MILHFINLSYMNYYLEYDCFHISETSVIFQINDILYSEIVLGSD